MVRMNKLMGWWCCVAILCFHAGMAQQPNRMTLLEQRLQDLSVQLPGINQSVTLSVSGASAQEFLRALAEAAELNINVDPTVDVRIYNNFQSATALNILLFIAKEYDLDIRDRKSTRLNSSH